MRVCLASLAAALLLSSAGASAQSVDWTGAYVGADLGGGMGAINYGSGSLGSRLAIGGLRAGANLQFGGVVIGAEGTMSLTTASASQSVTEQSCVYVNSECMLDTLTSITTGSSGRLTSVTSVRARAGVSLDAVLIYATAGPAWARLDLSSTTSAADTANRTETTLHGLVAGGGGEIRVGPNLSVRVEALHFDLGHSEVASGSLILHPEAGITTVQAGLSLHLN